MNRNRLRDARLVLDRWREREGLPSLRKRPSARAKPAPKPVIPGPIERRALLEQWFRERDAGRRKRAAASSGPEVTMDNTITVGDTVRESGAELRMRVVDIRESDDGRMLADCQYPEPGHPMADADGNRVGPFVLSSLIKVS